MRETRTYGSMRGRRVNTLLLLYLASDGRNNAQIFANFLYQKIVDFVVSGNGRCPVE